jgi:hypothetical protein
MDDNSKIIFDSMKDVYQQESERNNSYVFRNYIMLILSGLLLIQCAIKYNGSILFNITIGVYIITIMSFIYGMRFKTFAFMPEHNALCEYYEKEYSTEKLLNTMLGNYREVLNYNDKILQKRVYWIKVSELILFIAMVCNYLALNMI